jgi:ELWxxDGT repeat protein
MKKITFIALFTAGFGFCQAPQLAFDIYPGPNSSVPANPVLFDGNMYFSAYFSGFGSELTRFDGANMPVQVADVYPGFNSAMTAVDPVVFNDKIYFTATDGSHGYELWAYDGVNPASMVADIMPGANGSFPDKFVVFNGTLYFSADDGVHGAEIWQYDGVNPPAMLADMFAGDENSSSYADHFCVFDAKLYFSAKNSSAAAKIWRYDGVSPPAQVFPDLIAPAYIDSYDGKMYMRAYNTAVPGIQYLNFDGASLDIEPNITGPVLASLSGTAYFVNNADIATYGYELWKYDGVSPPVVAADVNPGGGSSNPSCVTAYGNKIYFVADDGTHGYEVWSYDGNQAALTAEITPTVIDPGITFMKIFNDKLYFNANNGFAAGQQGSELWVIDASGLATQGYPFAAMALYPNPATHELNIASRVPFDHVSLYDLSGRAVLTRTFAPTDAARLVMDLPPGIYAVAAGSEGQTLPSGKLIVR